MLQVVLWGTSTGKHPRASINTMLGEGIKRKVVRENADSDDDSINDGLFECFKRDGLVCSVDASAGGSWYSGTVGTALGKVGYTRYKELATTRVIGR